MLSPLVPNFIGAEGESSLVLVQRCVSCLAQLEAPPCTRGLDGRGSKPSPVPPTCCTGQLEGAGQGWEPRAATEKLVMGGVS